jgi:hypothetical protein
VIEKGEPWGVPAHRLGPIEPVVARSDAEVRAVVEAARRSSPDISAIGPVIVLGGDLCKTVGGTGDEARTHGPDAMALPCDVGSVLLDGRQHWFVAHLVARRSWWRGRVFVAMNAQFLGRFDVAPRGHPNDGRVEVIDLPAAVGIGDRVKAWRRLPLGTHVEHSAFRPRPTTAQQAEFDPPLRVWLDGVALGEVRTLSLRVEPDLLTVIV